MAKRSKATAPPPVAPLALPAELTIYTVGELRLQWLNWLTEGTLAPQARIEGNAVEQIDGAGLQMLLALGRSLEAAGRSLHIEGASAVLRSGCEALGLSDWLRERSHEGVAA